MNLMDYVKNVESEVISWRRHLHQIPEVGLDLPNTANYICKQLDEMGVSYTRGVGTEHAVVAEIKGGKPGKLIGLRADMDGLPIKEETGLSFASTNGNMHACGHDSHMAIMLGTIKILNQIKDSLVGTVRILFQPAEEINAGAALMIEGGALDGIDIILGLHVGAHDKTKKQGDIVISTGPAYACMDKFTVKVIGSGAHGANPSGSIDPITISAYILTSIQEIVSREIHPLDSAVVSVCQINSGSAFNIIPATAEIIGTARALTPEVREHISKRIGEIAENVANAFRAKTEYEYSFGPPPLVNTYEIAMMAYESSKKILGEDNVKFLKAPCMAGEDFAYYLEKKPGAFVFLMNPLEIDGEIGSAHSSKFAIDEATFVNGIAMFVQTVCDYLSEK